MPRRRPPVPAVPVVLSALLASCADDSFTPFVAPLEPIPPNAGGANGCNGAELSFGPGSTVIPVLTTIQIGPKSRIAAATDGEKLYLTGLDPSDGGAAVVELDFTGGGAPAETVLASSADFQQVLSSVGGITTLAEVSGIAVLQSFGGGSGVLVVMEHTSNSILTLVEGAGLSHFIGEMDETGEYTAPTTSGAARFDFQEPGDLCPAGDGRIFISDTGNDRVRVYIPSMTAGDGGPVITATALNFVATHAGTGTVASVDGDFDATAFDTPWGLSVSCGGQLLVSEAGDGGGGGHRLRGVLKFFGNDFVDLPIESSTLAGDGTPATVEGEGVLASLARPSPAVTTADGVAYWVDTLTGVLRRFDFGTETVDCPGFVDCASAVTLPIFSTTGGNVSLAISSEGALYVLDSEAGFLVRFADP